MDPAVVDLDDLCDACRARITADAYQAKEPTRSEKLSAFLGMMVVLWAALALLAVLTAGALRLVFQ